MPIEFIIEPDGLPGGMHNKICPDVIILKAPQH